jgi:outer membrane protein assembly factor BamD
MTRHSAPRLLILFVLVLFLGGCKTIGGWFGGDKQPETETLAVEPLYDLAKRQLTQGSYERASTSYQRLVARFPFGAYAEQSQLELAYVQFKPEDATSSLNRFIRTYPTHEHIAYAYYLKALVNFDRDNRLLARIARLDISARDLSAPTQSFNDFGEVVRRYPTSPYAADARQRMIFLRNRLARHEMLVGLYYYRRGAFVSSGNRGRNVVEAFPQSQYEADGVALMAASYTALGQKQLADDARRVLEKNYPQHPYLSNDWPRSKGLFRQLNPFAGELK